jgi:hypothetical protein
MPDDLGFVQLSQIVHITQYFSKKVLHNIVLCNIISTTKANNNRTSTALGAKDSKAWEIRYHVLRVRKAGKQIKRKEGS